MSKSAAVASTEYGAMSIARSCRLLGPSGIIEVAEDCCDQDLDRFGMISNSDALVQYNSIVH